MAGKVSLDLIGQVVLETRDDERDLRTLVLKGDSNSRQQ